MATDVRPAAAEPEVFVRTSEPPRLHVVRRFRELLAHREVLVNLVRKELKVKYKSSALGVVWSMLNPLLYLVVFFVIFTYVLPANIPNFAVYLLSGLIAWTLFSTATQTASVSVVSNANLVSKVAFPREILPLAAVGAALVNFAFQLAVLIVFMAAIRHPFPGTGLVLLPLALAVLIVFMVAIAFLVSAMNVRYRDTMYLVELGLLAWFWATPVVYPASVVLERLARHPALFNLYLANPLTDIVLGFQRAVYGTLSFPTSAGPGLLTRSLASGGKLVLPHAGLAWYAARLGVVGAVAAVLLLLSWRLFFHRSGDFAEEL